MDLANQAGGIVVGTGDLSELALGWATYNGDHMSMYAVNASIPKTLVRYLVQYEADHGKDFLATVLRDVLIRLSARNCFLQKKMAPLHKNRGFGRALPIA